ncbi:DUF4253 domain-containing protein [uncultured Imperialibacter sp.]|uniref:DUF4253 domain-containing protein n=1 Tax=uncultured Imperialibacter sp. TaxID=1672639 RepID=UPI0030DB3CCE|tara:strand:+ start:8383 stop:9060 length:678 start_codon:yes stop_codon:yes gene_type:complete
MRLILALTLLIFLGCKQQKDSGEKVTINGLEISKFLVDKIESESGKRFEPLKRTIWKMDPKTENGFRQADSTVSGIQIPFVMDAKARKIVRDYLPKFSPLGHYIYLKNLDFDENFENSYYDIAVITCKDQFELIEFVQTNGLNYDVTNEDVIEKLKKWNSECPFFIVAAYEDGIEADFIELPKDLESFAKEVYQFCPDVIEQGVGSEEELVKYFKTEKSFWLWWD